MVSTASVVSKDLGPHVIERGDFFFFLTGDIMMVQAASLAGKPQAGKGNNDYIKKLLQWQP